MSIVQPYSDWIRDYIRDLEDQRLRFAEEKKKEDEFDPSSSEVHPSVRALNALSPIPLNRIRAMAYDRLFKALQTHYDANGNFSNIDFGGLGNIGLLQRFAQEIGERAPEYQIQLDSVNEYRSYLESNEFLEAVYSRLKEILGF